MSKSSILLGGEPKCLTINGRDYKINTDFRVFVKFELMMQDRNSTDSGDDDKLLLYVLSDFYYGNVPDNRSDAADRMLEFYRIHDIQNIKKYTEQLYSLYQEKLELYRSQQLAELRKIELEKGKIDKESAAQHIANLKETLDQSNQITEEAYTAELTLIENKHNAGAYKDEAAYQAALQAAKDSHDARLAENQSFYDQGYAQIQDSAVKWTEADAQMWQEMGNAVSDYNQKHSDAFDEMASDTSYSISELENSYNGYFKAIKDGAGESAANMLQFAISIKESGQDVSDNIKTSTTTILDAFANMPAYMQEKGKDILLGLIKGMEDKIPGLENASEMSAEEIVKVLKEYLDINSPSKVTAEIGENTGKGLAKGLTDSDAEIKKAAEGAEKTVTDALEARNLTTLAQCAGNAIGAAFGSGIPKGIQDKIGVIKEKAASAVNAAISSARKAGDIHSPSKKSKNLVGKPLIQGIDKGMKQEQPNLIKRAAETTESIMARMRAAVIAQNAYMSARGNISNYSSNSTTNNYSTSNTSYNPTMNFYQPIQTPSQVARATRRALEVRD